MQAPSNTLPIMTNNVLHSNCVKLSALFGVDVLDEPEVAVDVPVMGVAIGVLGL